MVVEDEYFLADYVTSVIEAAGGSIEGPFPSVTQGRAWLHGTDYRAQAATLNVNLVDGASYPLADDLVHAGVPFVFISAHDRTMLPDRFREAPMLLKPFAAYQVIEALVALVGSATSERAPAIRPPRRGH